MNIFSNYIANKFLISNDKDSSWMTKRITNNVIEKIAASIGETTIDYQKLHDIRNEISQMISKSKKEHYVQLSKKRIDPLINSKGC